MSGFGAGQGADMLQAVLQRKFQEAIAQKKLAEDMRQADMQNAVQTRQLGQGDRKIGLDESKFGEDVRQFDAQAPLRIANVGHLNASTAALDRQPAEAEKSRTFTSGEAEKGRTFQGGQGDLNRGNAVRIAGINGQNALAVANARHPVAGPTDKEQNEVADSLALIKQIREDPDLAASVGPIEGRGGGYVTAGPEGYTRVQALHDNLVNKLQLAQAGKLKGQGQISDAERRMLASAATALSRNLGDADYLKELGKVEAQFQRMLPGGRGATPAAHGGGNMQAGGTVSQEFDYVPGKGLVPRK